MLYSAALVFAIIFPTMYQAFSILSEHWEFLAIHTIFIIKQGQGEEQPFEIQLEGGSHLSFCSSGLALRVKIEYLKKKLGESFDPDTMDAYYESYEHITDRRDKDNAPNKFNLKKFGQYFYAKFQHGGMPSEDDFTIRKPNGRFTRCRACTLVKESQSKEKEILGQIYYTIIQEYPTLTGYSSDACYRTGGGGDFVRTENPDIYFAFGI